MAAVDKASEEVRMNGFEEVGFEAFVSPFGFVLCGKNADFDTYYVGVVEEVEVVEVVEYFDSKSYT